MADGRRAVGGGRDALGPGDGGEYENRRINLM
jgi:hypothetical protein